MESVIVLFGKPGAGKGTRLSEFLEGRDQYEVLSVGNLLRTAKEEQTELGKRASLYMDAGQLVPDHIINELVIDKLANAERAIFTDGFPRTVAQARAMMEAGVFPAVVVEFYVDDEVVIERSKQRIVCKCCGETYTTTGFKPSKVQGVCDKCGGSLVKREDDEENVVRNRLKVYQRETYPVLQMLAEHNVRVVTIDNTNFEVAKAQFAELMDSLSNQ